jgi:hypothetical protein
MADALIAPIWLAATLLLGWAGWRFARRLFPGDDFAAAVMHTTVVCWAGTVAIATLLGLGGLLSGFGLLAGVAIAAALALWFMRRQGRPAVPAAELGPGHQPAAASGAWDRFWLVLWGLALAWALSRAVLAGLLAFPNDWDTLTYHLALVVQWLQKGSLYAPAEAKWANPGNNELLGLWMTGAFSGDFLIALNNLPAVILLGAGALEAARRSGLPPSLAHLFGLATVCTWPVLRQLVDAENDVAVLALFLAGFAYALRYARGARGADLGLAGVCLGLLAGVKYYALGYAATLWAALVLLAWLTHGLSRAGRAGLVGMAGMMAFGGYWYARNIVVTGTPFYPKGFTETTDLVGQIRTDFWQTTFLGSGRPEIVSLLPSAVESITGPGYAAAFLSLPLTLAWLLGTAFYLGRRAGKPPEGAGRAVLAFLLVGTGLIWGLTPFTVVPGSHGGSILEGAYSPVRYGLCFLSLAVLGMALLLHDLSSGLRWLLTPLPTSSPEPGMPQDLGPARRGLVRQGLIYVPHLVLALLVLYQVVSLRQRLAPDGLETLVLATYLFLTTAIFRLTCITWPRVRRAAVAAVVVALLLGSAVGADCLSRRWHTGFAAHYDRLFGESMFTQLAEKDPAGTRLCVLGYRYYPFFGSRRQFRVSRPHWVPSYEALLRYLDEHAATEVAALRADHLPTRRYDGKCGWLRDHPELFSCVLEGSNYVVFDVRGDLPERASTSR